MALTGMDWLWQMAKLIRDDGWTGRSAGEEERRGTLRFLDTFLTRYIGLRARKIVHARHLLLHDVSCQFDMRTHPL